MRSGRSDRNKNTSKFISLILRHKPETIGITLDEHGWADVRELIDGINQSEGHTLDIESSKKLSGLTRSSDTPSMRIIP